jgi:hypothetical protein
MITKQMKLDLLALDYTMKEINGLTPLQAHEILSKKIRPSISEPEVNSESEIDSESISHRDVIESSADKAHLPSHDSFLLTKAPHIPREAGYIRLQLSNITRIQSGLGNVKLKVNSSLASIETANEAVSAALDQIKK